MHSGSVDGAQSARRLTNPNEAQEDEFQGETKAGTHLFFFVFYQNRLYKNSLLCTHLLYEIGIHAVVKRCAKHKVSNRLGQKG